MLGPTTLAVEKRGSSTVNVRASRRTATARSYPVTSQLPRTGTQLTGAAARNRASAGCGSVSRPASVTRPAGDRCSPLAAGPGGLVGIKGQNTRVTLRNAWLGPARAGERAGRIG